MKLLRAHRHHCSYLKVHDGQGHFISRDAASLIPRLAIVIVLHSDRPSFRHTIGSLLSSRHLVTHMRTSDGTISAGSASPLRRQRGHVVSAQSETDVLQQWVWHGRQYANSAATLVSAWNDNHENALNQLATLMSTQDAPLLKDHTSIPEPSPRFVVTRDHAFRSSLRALRAHKRRLIGRLERQKKAELLQKQQLELEQVQREETAAESALAAEQERQRLYRERAEEELRVQRQRTLEIEQQKENERIKEEEAKRAAASQKATVSAPPHPQGDAKFQAQYKAWMEGPSKEWIEDSMSKNGHHDTFLEEVNRTLGVHEKFRETADVFRQDVSMKQPRMAMKKTINKAVNQISGTIAQVQWIVHQLSTVFQNAGSLDNNSAYQFAVHEIASRLVTEADTTVASNMDFAFSVGAIIVGITATAPNIQEMHDVMLGTFYSHCVFTRPHFPTKNKGEGAEEFRSRMGYRADETEEEFSQRVRGCMNLLGAVYQTELSSLKMQFHVSENPFSLSYAWTWLARVANRRQRAMAPDVVFAFLETTGFRLSQVYKTQFAKLVKLMQTVVITHASPHASKLNLTNLEVWFEDFVKNGNRVVEPPPGRNLPLRDVVNT